MMTSPHQVSGPSMINKKKTRAWLNNKRNTFRRHSNEGFGESSYGTIYAIQQMRWALAFVMYALFSFHYLHILLHSNIEYKYQRRWQCLLGLLARTNDWWRNSTACRLWLAHGIYWHPQYCVWHLSLFIHTGIILHTGKYRALVNFPFRCTICLSIRTFVSPVIDWCFHIRFSRIKARPLAIV